MPDTKNNFDAVIIGAGMSGIAAGIRFAHFGKKVIVLDRHFSPGGLNGFYALNKQVYDVGLHAMTNYVPQNTKNAPLTKLLRQLRISYPELDLCPQKESLIAAFGNELKFSNDFSLFIEEIARCFPKEIDNFRQLDRFLSNYNETSLEASDSSARKLCESFIKDPLLIDTIFIPLCFYGSSIPNDMALPQFAIMWKSIFKEGFARPHIGVRHIINILLNKYKSLGGLLKMNCGVQKIFPKKNAPFEILLDNNSTIFANKIFSSAGYYETLELCEEKPSYNEKSFETLGFCETITTLKTPLKNTKNSDKTIIFFCNSERFHYQNPSELVKCDAGVICLPNNYNWTTPSLAPKENLLRITSLANYDAWKKLGYKSENYKQAKEDAYKKMLRSALIHLSPETIDSITQNTRAFDMFTPMTIERFTGKKRGAIYGATQKHRDGKTPFENLFICGTDQGFLGITGAMLSGISIANLYGLK